MEKTKDKVNLVKIADLAEQLKAAALKGKQGEIEDAIFKLGSFKLARDNLSQEIREWVDEQGDYTWFLRNIRGDLHIMRKQEKDTLRRVIKDLKDSLVVEPGKRQGEYRKKKQELTEIKWWKAPTEDLPIILPFGMHRLVKIFPGNIIIYAGVQGHGKTAAILDTIRKNLGNDKLLEFYKPYLEDGDSIFNLYNSEAGDSEMRERVELISDIDLAQFIKLVRVWERSEEFHDVIKPNGVNFVDYFEVIEGEFAKVGHYLRKIHEKLDRGIAIIGLQKEFGARLGYGAGKSLEKARLYINFESGTLKVVKAKNWKTRTNPVGMLAKFRLVDGNIFVIDQELSHTERRYS